MKKNILFILFTFYTFSFFAQTGSNDKICIDTVIVILKKHTDYDIQKLNRGFNEAYYFNDTLFYCSSKKIKNKAKFVKTAYGATFDICINKSYCLFYTKTGKLVGEGYWNIEYFYKYIKSYHKNGKLKSEILYYDNLRVKTANSYDKTGKLIKKEEYNDKGELVK